MAFVAIATVFTWTTVIARAAVGAVTAWAVGVARCVARWARLATAIASAIASAIAALAVAWTAVVVAAVVAAGWPALVLPFTGLTVALAFARWALALTLATTAFA